MESIIALYEKYALDFDLKRDKSLFEKSWLDRFIAKLPFHGSVLDIGCGMGEPIAAYIIAQGFHVTGIDTSPSLIDLCQRRFSKHDWQIVDMRLLSFERKFDGVIAWHSLFHLSVDDQVKMFAVISSHLKSGWLFLFTSGSKAGISIGAWYGAPLYHASLSLEAYEKLLETHGFSLIERIVDDAKCGHATVWLAKKL
jgi:SAM-dependent methyltransferase